MSFSVCFSGTLEYLRSELLTDVRHGFSTRFGGVSTGACASLNLGIHRGDEPACVAENYRRFCAAIGVDTESLVFSRQTHSAIVCSVDASNCGEGLQREVEPVRDGLLTAEPGVTPCVFSADCAPVLLYDPLRGVIGAVHSGWRGTAQLISLRAVQTMMQQFGSDPAQIRAAVGPSIGKCCFETDDDVPDAMHDALGAAASAAITRNGKKYHVDNKKLIQITLLRAGLLPEQIDLSEDCTACQPNRFWSYRKSGDARGSLAALIALR